MRQKILIIVLVSLALFSFGEENPKKKIFEYHIVHMNMRDNDSLQKTVNRKITWAEPFIFLDASSITYQGFLTIYDDYSYECEFCTEGLQHSASYYHLTALSKENGGLLVLQKFDRNREKDMLYGFDVITSNDSRFPEAVRYDISNSSDRILSPEIGEIYLKNKWRREQNKYELLNATQLNDGDVVVDRSWKDLWRWKIIKEVPFTEEEKIRNKHIAVF